MTGGAVNHNESVGDGAGIYLAEGSTLNLSGAPDFGGTGVNAFDTAFNESGNLKTGALPLGTKNGCKNYDYSRARQDIYIAGYASTSDEDTSAASLVIDGNITSGDGTIWVWAAGSPHYKTLCQFAKYEDGVTAVAATLAAFRNARPDSDTGADVIGQYLYGVTKSADTGGNAFWYGTEGSRRVILRKVSSTFEALSGAKFQIHKGSMGGSLVESTDINGEKNYTFTSGGSGVYFIDDLPYGTYLINETKNAEGVAVNIWFTLTVDENGVGYRTTDPTDSTKTAYSNQLRTEN